MVSKDPGSVPENWRAVLPEEALETGSSLNDRSDCVVATDGLDRRAFCNHCQNGKPPRCHHCSVCRPSFLTFKCLVFSMFLVSFCYANILHVLDPRCVIGCFSLHHCNFVDRYYVIKNQFFKNFLMLYSLFCRPKMCSQDGSPLCLGGELCWST